MKIKNYKEFILESYRESISIIENWNYGGLVGDVFFDMTSFRKWLNQYGDFDITDEISKDINLPVGCIKNINIEEEFRGKGFGNKILNYFMDLCIDNDVKNIILIADMDENQIEGFDLVKWYESKGFEVIEYIHNNPVMILEI